MESVVRLSSFDAIPDAFDGAFEGRRVFLTGHTGFKGAWTALWLSALGADVHGYALEPPSMGVFRAADVSSVLANSTIGDIRDARALREALCAAEPSYVFHLAAQPLVRHSYADPVATFDTNVMGTVHLLEAVRSCPSVESCVIVTSDKCYENSEWEYAYRETDAMGGHDPYSSSKGCAELIVSSYRRSFLTAGGVGVASARAGNVVGGGDYATDRIVPDCIRALRAGEPVEVRNPRAIRPWQHVLEPVNGYLRLAAALARDAERFAGAWNFGPYPDDHLPVEQVADLVVAEWGEGSWHLADPVARNNGPREATFLRLDASKAMNALAWRPAWGVETALRATVAWHQNEIEAEGDTTQVRAFTLDQISTHSESTVPGAGRVPVATGRRTSS